MTQGKITDGDVNELVRSTADAASAYIRGDIQRYLTLIKHGDNYTLMPPYGGEPRRGFDVKALRTIVRLRKQDANERVEQETILETYMQALGML